MPQATPEILIKVAIAAGKSDCKNYDQLVGAFTAALNVNSDYATRVLRGQRPLTDKHKGALEEALGLRIDYELSEREFAATLGISRKIASKSVGDMSPGLDLTARTSDRTAVSRIQDLVGGYWESVYWSVSNTRQQAVSRDLCIIGDVDDNGYIECRIIDGHFEYSGVIFPVIQHLYFILEKDRFFNEVIFYVTNLPDRTPPLLRGIIGCLSGGVNDSLSYPSASKVAFRYLGRTCRDVQSIYPDAPSVEGELEHFLTEAVPAYLTRDDIESGALSDSALAEIAAIDNTLTPDSVPFALRATS